MPKPDAGLLERTGVRMTEEDGESLKKANEQTSTILASIGSTTASSSSESAADIASQYSPRL